MWLIKLLSYQYGHLLRAFELTYHTSGFTIGRLEVPQTTQDSWPLEDCRLLLCSFVRSFALRSYCDLCAQLCSKLCSQVYRYKDSKLSSYFMAHTFVSFLDGLCIFSLLFHQIERLKYGPSSWFIGTLNIFVLISIRDLLDNPICPLLSAWISTCTVNNF